MRGGIVCNQLSRSGWHRSAGYQPNRLRIDSRLDWMVIVWSVLVPGTEEEKEQRRMDSGEPVLAPLVSFIH